MRAFVRPSVSLMLTVGGSEVHDVGKGVTVGEEQTTLVFHTHSAFKMKIQCVYTLHKLHTTRAATNLDFHCQLIC